MVKLRVQFVDQDDVLGYYTGVIRKLKSVPNEMTQEMASAFRRRVKSRIPRSKSHQSQGHSTLTPMLQRLAPVRKVAGGHVVKFISKSEDGVHDLPLILERGAPSHTIGAGPKGPAFGIPGKVVTHPGIKRTSFWSLSFADFNRDDMKRLTNRGIQKIVGK